MEKQDRVDIWTAFAHTISFLTVVFETIVGVVLFILWSILWGWELFQGFFNFFLYAYLGVILVTFLLNFLMLFTRIAGVVSSIRKILTTGFLSLLTMTSLIIVSISPQFHDLLKDLYIIPTASYLLFVFISYLTQLVVSKGELYQILKSETENVKADFRELLSRQRILSEKIFYSLLLSLLIWGFTVGFSEINAAGMSRFLVQHVPSVTFFVLIIFLIGLALASYISIIPSKFLKKRARQLFRKIFPDKETEKDTE